MESTAAPLRFGVLTEGQSLPAWAAECVERLLASGQARLGARLQRPGGAAAAARRGAILPHLYHEHWVKRRSLALRQVELSERVAAVPLITIAGQGDATIEREALEKIRAARLDFILRFDARAVPEELLNLTRFGVWSFCQERRAVPCFRELVEGQAKTRMALERLTPGGAVCLHEGQFATCKASWVNNIDRARLGAADFCVRVCAQLANGGERRPVGSAETLVDAPPTNRDLARFLLRSATRSVEKLWELLFHVEIWNVGFTRQSVQQILRDGSVDHAQVTWCKPHGPGNFIADPFVYTRRGEPCVVVEDYFRGKGRICSVVPANAGASLELAVDLEFPYHMSYPCIFEEGDETYCIPETYQSRQVSLYRRTERGWELVRVLIEGKPAVDPTLFKHEGRYWLLFTLQDDGAWGNQKLYAYHAPALDSAWTAHALNPVKCDIGATRPAGNVFRSDGHLYRPSQDCSSTYGGAVIINRLLELSPTEFREEPAARIEPLAGGPYPHGFHTLNAMGSGAVFDSKKFAFDWFAWRQNHGRLHEVLR
jgi:hypothetical protein